MEYNTIYICVHGIPEDYLISIYRVPYIQMRSTLYLHIKYLEIEPRARASRRRNPMDPPNIHHMSPSTFDTSLLQPRNKKEKEKVHVNTIAWMRPIIQGGEDP